ncbi:Golgi phosphoprotein 3-domain-containing protein [Mycena sanguinolenta]|nr:Golgi phosphoprotein 3-domain-containing protein [Mycena sanguinolenta]
MASAGLSRRRAPAAASTTQDDDERPPTSPPAESRDNNDSLNASTINAHAGSAFANGSRIAFDPRDLALSSSEDALVGGKLPKLTLMEEVLLLGIKDKQGYLSFWNDNISYALRGCILIELALRRRIGIVRDPGRKRLPLPDRPITVLSTRQTGETLLDETLKMMKQTEDGGERMGVGTWVGLLSGAWFPFLSVPSALISFLACTMAASTFTFIVFCCCTPFFPRTSTRRLRLRGLDAVFTRGTALPSASASSAHPRPHRAQCTRLRLARVMGLPAAPLCWRMHTRCGYVCQCVLCSKRFRAAHDALFSLLSSFFAALRSTTTDRGLRTTVRTMGIGHGAA